MGRPRKGPSGRNETVTIRLTAAEKRQLEHCASRLGMTNTEVIVNGVQIISGMIEKHQAGREMKAMEDKK